MTRIFSCADCSRLVEHEGKPICNHYKRVLLFPRWQNRIVRYNLLYKKRPKMEVIRIIRGIPKWCPRNDIGTNEIH